MAYILREFLTALILSNLLVASIINPVHKVNARPADDKLFVESFVEVVRPKPKAEASTASVQTLGVGVVVASSLNVRDKPDGVVLTSISMNDEYIVLKEKNGWYQIATSVNGDPIGWVASRWMKLNTSTSPETVKQVGHLNEHSCPSGECWVDNATYWTPYPEHIVGRAVMYAPYLMEASAKFNGFDLTGYRGGVATSSTAMLGEVVWLKNPEVGKWQGPYLVVDVSSRAHVWTHVMTRHQSVEVDFTTAVEWGMAHIANGGYEIDRGAIEGVEVWTGLTPPEEASDPVVYRDYFLTFAKFGEAGVGNTKYWSIPYAHFVDYDDYKEELENSIAQIPQTHYPIQGENDDGFLERMAQNEHGLLRQD